MFSNIQSLKTPPATDAAPDTMDLLLGCHQRIRHFGAVAIRLANAKSVPAAEIAEAAEGLCRYFSIALPLHSQDEDNSIYPRLQKYLPAGELAGPAADAMVEQHQEIGRILQLLLPQWTILKANPAKLGDVAPELQELSARLEENLHTHLDLEEQTIFPAMKKYVPEAELAAIAREMEQRRK